MEKKLNKYKYFIIYTLIVILILLLLYFGLLPLTIYSNRFRFWLVIIPALGTIPFIFSYQKIYKHQSHVNINAVVNKKKLQKVKYVFYILLSLFLIFILMGISTWPVLGSTRYRNLMHVTESGGFTENIEDFSKTKVPIVDKDLAFRLGDKKLGEYKGMGSQFTVNNYTLIEMNKELYWVGNLEYTGFFKWLNNRNKGVPGYIQINATDTSDVKLVNIPMKYVPSAYFNQDLMRHIYLSGNMNKFFSNYTAFELDEKGHPYFIKTVLDKKFSYSSGEDAIGVVVCDAVSGEVHYYKINQAPTWIDRIQPPNIIIKQLGYYGKYVHGFFNTLFAKKEVLQVSEGYSYVYNNGEFYLYTGLTSVGADESIVGFTLTNMRTKQTTFYHIGGATEYSAQKSAQGAVQDLGYKANWPILVNFEQTPTYFMTLKDDEGLIKKYAYVNVKDYSIFGIGNTLSEAQSSYRQNLRANETNPNTGTDLTTLTAKIIRINRVANTANYYFILDNDLTKGYVVTYSVSFEIPLTEVGDTVTIQFYQDPNTNEYTVEKFDNLDINVE